ncbi:putative and NB-ARC domain-containing protein [Rosellinia necatrix]|uniref:Riboflavin kinase n=1 Tax=Rosellinia necatrix TaxID=77044 RepID=A0A1W2THT8_ROSNE|nr:putative and NB-ARC domain-containing protein [Rosellinia necatrix]
MNDRPQTPLKRAAVKSPLESYDLLDDLIDDYLEPLPTLVKTSSAVDVTGQPQVTSNPPIQDHRPFALRSQKSTPALATGSAGPPSTAPSLASGTPASSGSIWKTVLDETVYFAGGLISHPFESTKHYSILRHSSAIVYYQGPSTNITISVFGDSMLPSDRSFWIQRKGFSGNMGMAASALMRTTSNWIDVTPSIEAFASSAAEGDERVWQRDIKKFLKKAAKDTRLSKHVIRETCVLRIPVAAADGYLRIVMCTGQGSKKSLCPSPTFRLASTSSDVSVLRGASLTTLPLEIGLKAASVVGNQYAQRVIGPAQAVFQSKIKHIQPAFMSKYPGKLALKEKFGSLEGNFDASRDVTYSPFHEDGTLDEPPDIVGGDSGPEKPFPMKFSGKVVPGTGRSGTQSGIPTANLCNVSEELLLRLNGLYIGWAAVEQAKAAWEVTRNWCEAIIYFGPSRYAAPTVLQQKVVTVHIIHDFGEGITFLNAKLTVLVAAFLRPSPKPAHSQLPIDILAAASRDKQIAIASLSREMWRPGVCLEALSTEKSQRTLTDKYIGIRSQVQRHVDSFPIHKAGIRTDRAQVKDEAYGQGGFYIRR